MDDAAVLRSRLSALRRMVRLAMVSVGVGRLLCAAAAVAAADFALDRALRKSLGTFFPCIRDIRLTDYKVRVLNAQAATDARVRVLIETSDGQETWGTVGVSENIIEASWKALVDSITYKLKKEYGYRRQETKTHAAT